MTRPAFIKQPGEALSPRVLAAEGRACPFRMKLKAGALLLEAVREGFEAEGFSSGVLNLDELAFGPFGYVIPALSTDGRNAAFYSATFRPPGVTRLERGALTFGSRDGAPFFHCHAIWREADGKRSGGHVLPEETFVAQDAVVAAVGIAGAGFEAGPDSETNFTLFGPRRAAPRHARADRRAFALRLRPNQCIHTALEEFARHVGLVEATIHGGVGSTIGALFEDGATVDNFATEVFVTQGGLSREGADAVAARLDVGLIDYTGALAEGRLKRGGNSVLMTFEMIVMES